MLNVLLTIALLHWIVLLTPGVNFVLVTQLAASGHRRSAVFAAVGVTAVTLTWASLAVLGVGVVFSAHPALRQLFQLAGGLYLMYVALRMWRSSGVPASQTQRSALSPAEAFRRGFLTNILNPKTALFFGSVFATAMPASPSVGMVAAAIVLVYCNALVWHLVLALAFSHPRVQVAYTRHIVWLNRVCAAAVGAFGGRLLIVTAQEWRTRAG